MREIIFRGKTEQGKWVQGDLLHPDSFGNGYSIEEFTKGVNDCYDVIPETIGQYTGLTDKNGKKIFEGDIVNYDGVFCVVRYGKHNIRCCGCCYDYHSSVGFYLERDEDCNNTIEACEEIWDELYIIGNIHDNPELMEGATSDA